MSAGVEQLKGSIPPLITPFRNGEVDLAGYAGLVDFQVEQDLMAFWSMEPPLSHPH